MDRLEVPVALAGIEIEADDGARKEIGAGTMAAEVVAGGVFGREIHAVQLFVDRDRRPVAGVARVRPRIVLPRVVAELAGLRNRVEDPQTLAGAHVVAADVALDVLLRARRAAGQVSGADDDDVVAERGRRVEADVGGLEIDAGLIDLGLQIDDAVPAERRRRECRSSR